jgi:hypothetical protein
MQHHSKSAARVILAVCFTLAGHHLLLITGSVWVIAGRSEIRAAGLQE